MIMMQAYVNLEMQSSWNIHLCCLLEPLLQHHTNPV